eukprot:563325-Hanusia_phi.AAC.1
MGRDDLNLPFSEHNKDHTIPNSFKPYPSNHLAKDDGEDAAVERAKKCSRKRSRSCVAKLCSGREKRGREVGESRGSETWERDAGERRGRETS